MGPLCFEVLGKEREGGGRGRERKTKVSPFLSFNHAFLFETIETSFVLPRSLSLAQIAMRSTLASTRVSTRSSTVAARASSKQQQAVAPAAPASLIVSKERSSLPIAARVFSAVAAAMVAVTGPAFADLNAFEAAAGGGEFGRETLLNRSGEKPR